VDKNLKELLRCGCRCVRDFLKILGSDFILKDRNLLFSTKKPFSLLPRKGLDEVLLPLV
jgi:hypothetical protein